MDRYIVNAGSLLSSQLSFRQFNADVLPNRSAPYQLLVETENIPAFPYHPNRSVLQLNPVGQVQQSISYLNQITSPSRDPRSQAWNFELVRQVTSNFLLRADQQRDTVHDFVLTPIGPGETGVLSLAKRGRLFYREFQMTGRYRIGRGALNASYTRSRADSQTAKADFPAGVAR